MVPESDFYLFVRLIDLSYESTEVIEDKRRTEQEYEEIFDRYIQYGLNCGEAEYLTRIELEFFTRRELDKLRETLQL